MISALRSRQDERFYWGAIAILVALAWIATVRIGALPYAQDAGHGASAVGMHARHHGGMEELGGGPALLRFILFAGAWTAMAAAMMLPTTLPLLTLFRATVGGRADGPGLLVSLIAGYLSVWTVFGLVLQFAGGVLHGALEAVPRLAAAGEYLLPGALVLAGLYQYTPLKGRCLQVCRSPLSFLVAHWRGTAPWREAFRLGAHHGIFCLGCCWTLMIVMFALGAAHLPGMLILGAVMAAEKTMPWGRRLVRPVGVVLVLAGVGVAVRAAVAG